MKKLITLIAFLSLFGCSVGGVELTKNAVFCESEGQRFQPGESVALPDGCNSCICSVSGELENCSSQICENPADMANPAAVKCSVDGFRYEIREDADGNQSGFCIDESGKECSDWEFFREECALGQEQVVAPDEPVNVEPSQDVTIDPIEPENIEPAQDEVAEPNLN